MSKIEFETIRGNHYETPDYIFNYFDRMFKFDYDLAASENNRKLDKYLSKEDDSLSYDWHTLTQRFMWLNPPYSPLKPWIQKAQKESKLGAKIVMLVPPILNTRYLAESLPSTIYFIVGRINFLLDGEVLKGNTKDNCVFVFDNKEQVTSPSTQWIFRDMMKDLNQPPLPDATF